MQDSSGPLWKKLCFLEGIITPRVVFVIGFFYRGLIGQDNKCSWLCTITRLISNHLEITLASHWTVYIAEWTFIRKVIFYLRSWHCGLTSLWTLQQGFRAFWFMGLFCKKIIQKNKCANHCIVGIVQNRITLILLNVYYLGIQREILIYKISSVR